MSDSVVKFVARSDKNSETSSPLLSQLRQIILDYLALRPHLSVNAVSKKTGVSEPTLRRIVSQKIKTEPQISTVLDLLTYVSGVTSVRELVKIYAGPVADYINESVPFLDEMDKDYSNQINEELKNPIKYLIYKLALNASGVSEEKIIQLYGNHGFQLLNEMIECGLLHRDQQRVCRTVAQSFSSSYEDFVRNFKLVADFIKPYKSQSRQKLNPLFVNFSESISPQAYEELSKLQKKTLKKMREILSREESKGSLPSFFLCALDTMDLKSAYELASSDHSSNENQN